MAWTRALSAPSPLRPRSPANAGDLGPRGPRTEGGAVLLFSEIIQKGPRQPLRLQFEFCLVLGAAFWPRAGAWSVTLNVGATAWAPYIILGAGRQAAGIGGSAGSGFPVEADGCARPPHDLPGSPAGQAQWEPPRLGALLQVPALLPVHE